MRRLTVRMLTWASAALAVVLVALWAFSDRHVCGIAIGHESWAGPDAWRNRGVEVRVVQGHVLSGSWSNTFDLTRPEGIVQGWGPADATAFRAAHPGGFKPRFTSYSIQTTLPVGITLSPGVRLGKPNYLLVDDPRYGFGYTGRRDSTPSRTDVTRHVLCPAWLPLAACLLLPGVAGARALVRRRRRGRGVCAACGYDLRASPDRCPECGARPAAA